MPDVDVAAYRDIQSGMYFEPDSISSLPSRAFLLTPLQLHLEKVNGVVFQAENYGVDCSELHYEVRETF